MKSTMSLSAGLGLGIIAYCMTVLVSREAAVSTLLIMGMTSLSLIAVSLWLLWSVALPGRPALTDRVPITTQPPDNGAGDNGNMFQEG